VDEASHKLRRLVQPQRISDSCLSQEVVGGVVTIDHGVSLELDRRSIGIAQTHSQGRRVVAVALSEIDRNLLTRCLARQPRAWEDFVDRFMGLVIHVIDHSVSSRSLRLAAHDREDLVGEVFLNFVKNDYSVLRRFRGESSLATYLTVITRRVVVHRLVHGRRMPFEGNISNSHDGDGHQPHHNHNHVAERFSPVQTASDRDEVARLLQELEGMEADVVRMYHLEGKSYQEISSAVGMPENSIGPTLSRAREKMRRASVE